MKLLVTIGFPRCAPDFRESAIVVLVLLAAALLGCGIPGAPLPPSADIPRFVGDLKAVRKGDTVTLTWTTPTETSDGELIRKPGKMLVQRALRSGPNSDLVFQTISELPLQPTLKEGRGDQATAKDTLANILHSGGADFAVYTVLAEGHNGKSFGLPNRVSVPLVPNLPPPQKVAARAVPTGVMISWEESGSAQPSPNAQTQYVYKLMRRLQGAKDPVLVTQLHVSDHPASFIDTGIEWEKSYQYWIVSVTVWQDENRKGEIEGEDSPVVDVLAHDSFPPAVPTGLEAVYSPAAQNSFIDITWTANTEPDLAGYNVYRHGENESPVKINSDLVKTPRFADPGIQQGMKYFYSVTAIDLRGNESSKSEETSESVPKD
ncbi:MAG TPA: fibronectin type III domain-containing protein [Candidatus Angelobacter sp.]|nr:fibronectin type III domain-containing protein [Candidatus Angelobacter sp.]